MREFLLDGLPWGVQVILWIQARAGGGWDSVVRAVTTLGSAYVFALAVALYWGVERRLGMRLIVLWLVGSYLNQQLKALWSIPRPFQFSPAVQARAAAEGYSFPSGHAQLATLAWLSLAFVLRKWWAFTLAALLILVVSFSRVYLGMHYPQDVIAGVVLGLLLVWLDRRLRGWLAERWQALRPAVRFGLAVALLALAVNALPPQYVRPAGGAALGLVVGYVLEQYWLTWVPCPGAWFALGRLVTGGLLFALTYDFWRAILPPAGEAAAPFGIVVIAYASIGLAMMLLVPALFVWLRLAHGRDNARGCASRARPFRDEAPPGGAG